jgi:TPR repeat protein
MSSVRTNPSLKKIVVTLRRRVAQGDASAMCDLGMWLQEGFQDKKGRAVIRSNPAYAFRLLNAAAEKGDAQAFVSLGFAYDTGLGTRRSKSQAVRWYRQAYRSGQSLGAANLATVYRDAGDFRRAFAWWMRAVVMGDGDAMGDTGYCYQYGIGVRKNIAAARMLYKRAIASRDISMWGREEALYHLGISYIDAGKRKLALPYLKRAAKDGDYPEAEAVLEQIRSKLPIEPCRCRRFILKTLRGHTLCQVHPRKTRR